MNKKQKKVLIRIIVAFVLLVILSFVPVDGWIQFALYMIPYLCKKYNYMRLLNADSVQFFAWNRENKTCEKRRKFDVFALQTKTY